METSKPQKLKLHDNEANISQAARALTLAREVLLIEAQEVEALAHRLDENFSHAVELILHCHGRIVVSGMGKSGHIGGKIASTLASTGTPAFLCIRRKPATAIWA